jgi:hypothetical protein
VACRRREHKGHEQETAAGDSRIPKRKRRPPLKQTCARFWSAAVLCRFGGTQGPTDTSATFDFGPSRIKAQLLNHSALHQGSGLTASIPAISLAREL